MRVKVRTCALANREHEESKRQYAHVGHKDGTICVANAFFSLPLEFRWGILYHELGHLAGAEGEMEADRRAEELFGVRIERVDSRYGSNLQRLRV